MQSKTSFFNKTIWKKNLGRSWALGLLWFIILCYAQPIQYFILLSDRTNTTVRNYGTNYVLLDALTYFPAVSVVAAVFAIVAAMLSFYYLFQKRDNYMMHSFPVSRKALFFSGLGTILPVMILPILLKTVIMLVMALATGAGFMNVILYKMLIEITAVVIFTGIALFSLMISGQAITAVVFYFIFNFMFEIMKYILNLFVSTLMFGMGWTEFTDSSASIFTPIFYIYSKCTVGMNVEWSETGEKLLSLSASLNGSKELVAYILVGLLLMAIAYVLYQRKQLETVHDFITVMPMKWVFTVGISFFVAMVLSLFTITAISNSFHFTYVSYFATAIILTLLYGVIVFFITQMMIEKTVRVFDKKKVISCAIYSGAALVILLTLRLDIWNIENYVPDADEVEWAGYSQNYTQVYTDEENIQKLIDVHKAVIADKKDMRDMSFLSNEDIETNAVTIRYKLKNGKTISRRYYFESTDEENLSQQYLDLTQQYLALVNDPDNIKEHIIGNIWNDCQVTDMYYTTAYDEDDNAETVDLSDLSEAERFTAYHAVYEAVLKDIDAGNVLQETLGDYEYENLPQLSFTISNEKEAYSSDENKFYNFDYDSDDYVVLNYSTAYSSTAGSQMSVYVEINKNCTNTKKALEKYGFIGKSGSSVRSVG